MGDDLDVWGEVRSIVHAPKLDVLALLDVLESAVSDLHLWRATSYAFKHLKKTDRTWANAPSQLASNEAAWLAAGFDTTRAKMIERAVRDFVHLHWMPCNVIKSRDEKWLLDLIVDLEFMSREEVRGEYWRDYYLRMCGRGGEISALKWPVGWIELVNALILLHSNQVPRNIALSRLLAGASDFAFPRAVCVDVASGAQLEEALSGRSDESRKVIALHRRRWTRHFDWVVVTRLISWSV